MKAWQIGVGIFTGVLLTCIFWVVGRLTPNLIVYTNLYVPNVLMFWIISGGAMIVTEWLMKSPPGDYPIDFLAIAPVTSIIFVGIMNIICSHEYWFAADMFEYGSWIGISAFIVIDVLIAGVFKTKVKEGK